ncbi:glycosyltransferase family 4 protein [Sphingomonas sp. LR59]
MTRICLLTDSLAPSGVGAHMMTLAEGLGGDEIVVAARPGTGLLEHAAAKGYAVKALDDDAGLARWLDRAAPDIVHVHAGIGWEGHAAVRAAHAAGVPVIRTEHLPYLLTDPAQRDEHRDTAAALARLICVSDAVGDTHRAAGVDPALVATIHNGVGAHKPSRSREALRSEWGVGTAPVLLMVARFAEQKGHALLLDALPAIHAAHPDAIVLLAGEGPLLTQTARAVAAQGLAGTVRMLGTRGDVADLMTLADLLVLPSAFEGLPLVALEAMAAGLPVVATVAPGNAEAIEDCVTGRLTAADPASFADAIVTLLTDRDRLKTMASAAIERQQDLFSADRMIADTRAVYAAVQDQNTRETAWSGHGSGSSARAASPIAISACWSSSTTSRSSRSPTSTWPARPRPPPASAPARSTMPRRCWPRPTSTRSTSACRPSHMVNPNAWRSSTSFRSSSRSPSRSTSAPRRTSQPQSTGSAWSPRSVITGAISTPWTR